ncbi:MAG: helix-turn-helix domain-containing protein [Oscillospiraceae bacterium]|nr:helix-turn-helix domain-containing protein [Oscillospiraceae bacterium]
MSSRLFQSMILQMKSCTDRYIGVIDAEGTVVSCNKLDLMGASWPEAITAISGTDGSATVFNGHTFKPLTEGNGSSYDYAAFAEGTDDKASLICSMAAVALSDVSAYYDEKHDRAAFIKSVISDNVLMGDIYARAKELHMPVEVPRAVLLIRQETDADPAVLETIQAQFPDRMSDFVIHVSDTDIAVILQLPEGSENQDLYKTAEVILEAITNEHDVNLIIGIGTIVYHIRDLARSYKEAQVAIDVGKVFDTDKEIIHYENLGIGRLIYQLPTTLCEMFLQEVLKKNPISSLSPETLYTINKFFENNLNVSETARKLFVHRNTLVYRLEKIKKLTGLDLREFDDAITFKVALMVKQYLASRGLEN